MGFLDARQGGAPDREGRLGPRRRGIVRVPSVEGLESRTLLASNGLIPIGTGPEAGPTLTAENVGILLDRAARASASDDAIIAVVDREGNLLGIRVEAGVAPEITNSTEQLVFAIDGAISKARTGSFFANNQAPLTSRTIQNISQSTITQREVESNPNIPDANSIGRGPGFVAPIGKKGHFPPRVMFTPQVDLFQIEHTNRDSIVSPGADHIRSDVIVAGGPIPSTEELQTGVGLTGQGDDIVLSSRFNVDPQFIPPGQEIGAPESYGLLSGLLTSAQSRGIATLPGGIPIFQDGSLVGGIGVFFPGKTGFATEENSSLNDAGFFDPLKPDRSMEAEYIAFVAAGGSKLAGFSFNTPATNQKLGLPALPSGKKPLKGFDLPSGRIDLVGISLDIFGGHGRQGPSNLVDFGRTLGLGDTDSGSERDLPFSEAQGYAGGTLVPQGWLVAPHDAPDGSLTAADVTAIVERGVAEAKQIRAAIRLPLDSTARMVFSVTDKAGNVLGLYRMVDATFFSIDVAVAKARNVAYYADPEELQDIDQVKNLPKGVAMTNRTFRYLAEPRFPEGIDINPPGPFSILNEVGVSDDGAPLPASAFQSVQGFDSFNPMTNFHDPFNIANQNGIVFFPGSAPLYKDLDGDGARDLVGGLGVSGDGVDQDDDVTFQAATGFEPPAIVARADQVFVRGVRLPYQKFNRQPHVPFNQPKLPLEKVQPILSPGKRKGFTSNDISRLLSFRAFTQTHRSSRLR